MKTNRTVACVLAACAGFAEPARAATISGRILTAEGNPAAGARVSARSSGGAARTTAGADGSFRIDVPGAPPVALRVEAAGSRTAERTLATDPAEITITLSQPAVAEEITVTASRTPRSVAETAAPTTILPREELESSPASVIDDALRRVPGFSLFRRSGSRTANPTSQGVSLRGLGPSGTSRALVLADDVPMNDPFGGWVYWGRVPEIGLERVEVVEGGASDLWGSAALAGVVRLVRRDDAAPAVEARAWGGSESSADGALRLAGAAGPVRASADAEIFRTSGYVVVAPEERGPVDVRAGSRHRTFEATVEATAFGGSRVFLRGSRYLEERENGTRLQKNDTGITEWTGGFDGAAADGAAALRAYRSDETFHQTFSAVSADRSSETLTSRQFVPSSATGGSAQWARAFGAVHQLVAGADYREVEGVSNDTAFLPSGPALRPSGGKQRSGGAWVEDVAAISARVTVSGSVRWDSWSNLAGRTFESGAPLALPDRSAHSWSPRLSAIWAATRTVSFTASASRAFRAPTLNELYRPFRLGDVQTLANADLAPETATSAEAGARFQDSEGRLFARANLFWTELHDAVGNVTISSTPSLITRRRENVGRIRDRGAELAVDVRLSRDFRLSAGYLFADSRVVSSAANPELVGRRVPQVPRNQATLALRFTRPAIADVAVEGRWSGPQYDDDANAFRLASAFTLDAYVSRDIGAGLSLFAAGENLTGRRNEIGRTPTVTLGPSRAFRAGLRWRI